MQELRDKEAEDRHRAQLIEASLEEIDALLQLVRASREKSMDWQELTRLIVEAAKQGDPLASMVHSLDPNPTPHPHASPSPSPSPFTLTLCIQVGRQLKGGASRASAHEGYQGCDSQERLTTLGVGSWLE